MDRNTLFLNLLLLMFVGFIPFPTAFLADALHTGQGERVAAVTYGLVMAGMGMAFSLCWTYAVTRSRAGNDLQGESLRAVVARSWIGPAAYLAAAGLAALTPHLALGLYALVALYFAHPGRRAAA